MTVQTLPNTGLKYNEVGDPDWLSESDVFNITRLNNTLLYFSALLDVDVSGVNDQDGVRYNSSSSKWEPYALPGGFRYLTTTTIVQTTTTTI